MFTPPETLEAAEAARARQEEDAAQDELFKNPEYVADLKAKNLASSPYGSFAAPHKDRWEGIQIANLEGFSTDITFDEEEKTSRDIESELDTALATIDELEWNDWESTFTASQDAWNEVYEEHNDELYDKNSAEWKIYNRIAARVDTEFWWNPEILVPELFSEEAKERNTQRSEELFFSPEVLSGQIAAVWWWTAEVNTKENQQWLDTNIGENWVLREAFERIEGNFVLPANIEGDTLSEIHQNDPKNAMIVNDALSDAFLLEIQLHTLKWRVNYPEETVQALIKEIQDPKTIPFEKLQKFWEIHTIVERSVARGGAKQSKEFQSAQAAKKQQRSEEFQNAQAALEKAQWEWNQAAIDKAQSHLDDLAQVEEKIQGWEAWMWWWEIDALSEAYETTQKTA